MAKKDGRKKKDTKKGSGAADTVEAVRSAVERALPEGSRERGRELVDEVARAVTRVRHSLEEHGVFDELGKLRSEVESLARRVANLERPGAPSRTTPTTTRPVKARSTATKRASTASKASRTKGSSTKASSTKRSPTTKASSSRASKSSSTKASSTKRASTSKRARSKSSSTRTSGSGS